MPSGSSSAFGHPSVLYAKSLIPGLSLVTAGSELNDFVILYAPPDKRNIAPNALLLDSP